MCADRSTSLLPYQSYGQKLGLGEPMNSQESCRGHRGYDLTGSRGSNFKAGLGRLFRDGLELHSWA